MGFSREQVQVKGYLILRITFVEQYNTKEIKVKYLVINALSSYNMIIGQLSFNWLRIDLHTLYLCMKYPFFNGRVGVVPGYQETTKKWYVKSLN